MILRAYVYDTIHLCTESFLLFQFMYISSILKAIILIENWGGGDELIS